MKLINEQLDEIVYSLSHDFRSPILAAIGMSDILLQQPEKIQQVFSMLNQSLRRVDNILINIHHFSQNLRRPVAFTNILLRKWLYDVYISIKHPNKNDVLFKVNCAENMLINSDDYRLEIMLRQLFLNSLQFAKQPDKVLQINIDVFDHKGWVTIQMDDNGPGIPEKYMHEQLGSMFRRGSALSNGAGLGIFLCKEMAAKVGIEIRWGNSPSGGTRINLDFV